MDLAPWVVRVRPVPGRVGHSFRIQVVFPPFMTGRHLLGIQSRKWEHGAARFVCPKNQVAVSYTHLTLPTIYAV